jgi:hypothetical protein
MNNDMKNEILSNIPKRDIIWYKEIEVHINGYFNENVDMKDKGIVFNVYPPFQSNSVEVLIKWEELEELVSDYGFEKDEFIKLIENKINLY